MCLLELAMSIITSLISIKLVVAALILSREYQIYLSCLLQPVLVEVPRRYEEVECFIFLQPVLFGTFLSTAQK